MRLRGKRLEGSGGGAGMTVAGTGVAVVEGVRPGRGGGPARGRRVGCLRGSAVSRAPL